MGVYGGLKPEDWRRWGQFTTFKSNAAELLRKSLRPEQIVYCSPLVDPYQPAEERECMMPALLDGAADCPPRIFVIQTRGPSILRDLDLLTRLAARTKLRVSFSLTTNREAVRKLYEPHCATFDERLAAIRALRAAGIETYATLAPLLPCDPETLVNAALDATDRDIIGDPLHIRATKRRGATTREAALEISRKHGHEQWHSPEFQRELVERIREIVKKAGRRFAAGTEGFSWLAQLP